jgi:hypothetical protein
MHPVRVPHRQRERLDILVGSGDGSRPNGRSARSASWSTGTAVHTRMNTSKRRCALAGFEALRVRRRAGDTEALRVPLRRRGKERLPSGEGGTVAILSRPQTDWG